MTDQATETEAGNYFISNYPPYSCWKPEFAPEAVAALEREPEPGTPLGIYLHIPFCRKRCHFCYFRVYTDKNSEQIQRYLDAALKEIALYAKKPVIGGRKPSIVYFGGGTPSYLSVRQLQALTDGMKSHLPWDEAEEVTFECEPGTLTEPKLKFLRDMGVTRLSLGVEHFNQKILEDNGRAHGRKEIDRVAEWLGKTRFPQVNIDLIAGMMGENDETWWDAVERTVELAPDSVTIYQMEVPYNTTIYQRMKDAGVEIAPVASWDQKRAWVSGAFDRLGEVGYSVNSTCTVVKDAAKTRFRYRESLFGGDDLIGLGVASFGQLAGTHYQNEHNWEPYIGSLESGKLPIHRALTPSAEETLIRELVLRLKLGSVATGPLEKKHGVVIRERFADQLSNLTGEGHLTDDGETLTLDREGLLQVDRLALDFFLPEHRNARYA